VDPVVASTEPPIGDDGRVFDIASVIDTSAYPLDDPASPELAAVIGRARAGLEAEGVAELPGFVRADVLASLVAECDGLAARAHHQDVLGTPYLATPDEAFPEGHPRRWESRSALSAVAYDEFPADSALRRLYESSALLEFIAAVLGAHSLYRYADPLGALNVAAMREGDELGWHFDQTDFVVSIALQSSEQGGEFEMVANLRTLDEERFDAVASVLAGNEQGVSVLPMKPGTLLVFKGRHSLHRVTRVGGERPRYVALLAYDTQPGTDSSELLKLVRYGRLPGAT